jgi:hypothetical protein
MAKHAKGSSDSPNEGGNVFNRELVVKMLPEARFRSSLKTGPTALAADASPFADVLNKFGADIEPLFGFPEERMQAMAAAVGHEVADTQMETFYSVTAPDKKLDELAEAILDQSKLVEAAYVKPESGEPVGVAESNDDTINEMLPMPGDGPPVSPDFTASQIYLNPAPAGIDAGFAWNIAGGRGNGVKIIDCEWGWNFSHEDLIQKQIGVVFGGNSTNNNHGTAVLGEYSGDVNSFGITGICSDAIAGASSFVNSPSTARTIREAADRLNGGLYVIRVTSRHISNSCANWHRFRV